MLRVRSEVVRWVVGRRMSSEGDEGNGSVTEDDR